MSENLENQNLSVSVGSPFYIKLSFLIILEDFDTNNLDSTVISTPHIAGTRFPKPKPYRSIWYDTLLRYNGLPHELADFIECVENIINEFSDRIDHDGNVNNF